MNEKKKIAIGFDLGTTSVGWSVIQINSGSENEKLKILDMGVRLFDDPNPPTSSKISSVENRRIARGRRRRINRLKIRKFDLYKLLKEFKIVEDKKEFDNYVKTSIYDEVEEIYKLPVEIKIKGLSNKLNKHELILILHNYIKHRGSLNTLDLSEEEEKQQEKDQSIYNKELLPCQNQFNWFLTTGKIIGNKGNYLINNEDYIKEINQILSNQTHLVNDEFADKFIELFKRHRHYSEGPGSENSLTKYGRVEQIKDEKGNIKLKWIGGNLWDLLKGKCTYYPNEDRNYKKSPITEMFNLWNDLNNIVISVPDRNEEVVNRYLTKEEKIKITSLPHDKLTLDKMMKEIGLTKKHIVQGLKGIKDKKPTIDELKSTINIIKWLIENNLINKIDLNNLDDLTLIDDIFFKAVQKQNPKDRFEYLKDKNNQHIFAKLKQIPTDEQLNSFVNLKIFSSGSSSLSKKAQLEFIKFAMSKDAEGKNQMHYFNELSETRIQDDKFKKYKFFPSNFFEKEIMPSTVKRTFNQATKVLNAILKKYENYQLSHIIIELARELNSAKEAANIEQELNTNKKFFEKKLEEHGLNKEDLKGGTKRLKFLLWVQQNKQDIYDGQEIKLNDLLSNPNAYHIDHIIPVSISFIDSMQNKVLTKAINNEQKGDKTPWQWLSSNKYKEYETRCKNLLNEVQDKKMKLKLENKINNYLLYKKDPFNEFGGFVERQLNDTRYISVLFSNQLKNFFKQSDYWKSKNKVVISPINGSLTSLARKLLFNEKDCEKRYLFKNRDIYNHHAIDASIIAYLGLNSKIENFLKYKSKDVAKTIINGKECYIDRESGEILVNKEDFFQIESNISKYYRNQMRDFINPDIKSKFVRFSRMVISKNNIPFSNETIYSLKSKLEKNKQGKEIEKYYKKSKLSLLNDSKSLSNFFGPNAKHKEKLAIYQNDLILYNKLNDIYNDNQYNTNKNISPFFNYLHSDFVKENLKFQNNQYFDLIDKFPIFNKDLKITHWIKNLTIIENEVNLDYVFTLKKHFDNAYYDSLNFVGIRIYKTFKNKYQPIFLSVLNTKWDKKKEKLIVDENKINQIIEKLEIDKNKGFIEIKKGMTLIKDGYLYYFNGGGDRKTNKLELKSLSCKNEIAWENTNWKNAPKRKQWQISISTIANNFKLCKVDYLGNVYDIQSFEEYFEKIIK